MREKLSPEYLEAQGKIPASVYCEGCDYVESSMPTKDLCYKISMLGGYIMSDQEGGYFSKCPKCGGTDLTLGDPG